MFKSFFKQNPATTGFLILITAVYLVTSYPGFLQPARWAVEWGILFPGLLVTHEYWRLFTASLMHADLGHWASNAFGAYVFGQWLEPIIGARALILLLSFACVCSGLVSALFLKQPTLGASGLIYGMTGAYFTLVLLVLRLSDPDQFKVQLRSGVLLLAIFLYTSWNEQSRINGLAHLGGLISGVVYAGLFYWDRRRQLKANLAQNDQEPLNVEA